MNIINQVIFLKKIYIFLSIFLIFDSFLITSYANVTLPHIVLDAGHGGMDGGTSVGDVKESDLTLEIVFKIRELLISKGYVVTLTRENKNSLCEGKFIKRTDMNKRVEIINNSNADLALSIHLNHYSDSKYKGAQVFYCDNIEENGMLASSIQDSIINKLKNTDRKIVIRNNIYLLNRVAIPTCIIECGFMSNYNEFLLLKSSSYQHMLAEAIVDGISVYIRKR
jgi:N-acetylmuramoyl-L-alanine amidase